MKRKAKCWGRPVSDMFQHLALTGLFGPFLCFPVIGGVVAPLQVCVGSSGVHLFVALFAQLFVGFFHGFQCPGCALGLDIPESVGCCYVFHGVFNVLPGFVQLCALAFIPRAAGIFAF